MQRYHSPIVPITAADTSAPFQSNDAGTANGGANSAIPPAGVSPPSNVVTPPEAQAAPSAADQARAQKYLDSTLKNTGYKAEISNERNGYTVVRLVQADTGQVILQMPSQAVIAILASLDKQESQESGMPTAPATGGILDRLV